MSDRNAIINDMSIHVATINGSGSQSSNNILMRSIFKMGVPVGGKNLFPSNIAGLPTWFTIRASKNGYAGRKKEIDWLIAMNQDTVEEDVAEVHPGGVILYDAALKLPGEKRSDVTYYPVPFSEMAGHAFSDARLKKLLTNMVYVGAAAHLLGIDKEAVDAAIQFQFKDKPKAVPLNRQAIELGIKYAGENLRKQDPYRIERMNRTEGKIIIDGNTACALGAMFGGCTFVSWYPITPSSSLGEAAIHYFSKYRVLDGKATFAIVQAEDELAAAGMAIGAGWAGARAMTTTSGPGVSLMGEFAGLAYFAEIPVVIMDVQRVGPSTGLPTRTSQGDVLKAAFLSHGDTRHVLLFPADMRECFEFGAQAFDLADRLQTPVFVMTDLDLGMNNWMSDPLPYPDKLLDRGKVLGAKDIERLGKFERYRDVDGDGICYRTLPGTNHALASYFTRGTGHNEAAKYSERPRDWSANLARLLRKYQTAKKYVPKPVLNAAKGARTGIIAYGSTDVAVHEARDLLQGKGSPTNYLRIRAVPFTDEVFDFIRGQDRIYVVEQNRDAQLTSMLKMELGAEAERLRPVLHYSGIPLTAQFIADAVLAAEKGGRER